MDAARQIQHPLETVAAQILGRAMTAYAVMADHDGERFRIEFREMIWQGFQWHQFGADDLAE